MDQMPPELKAQVQKMIDAGAQDDEILRVVKAYTPPVPSMGEQVGGALRGGIDAVKETAGAFTQHPKEAISGFLSGAGEGSKRFLSKLGQNALGIGQGLVDPVGTAANAGREAGVNMALQPKMPSATDAIGAATGVDLKGGPPEIGADLATAVMLGGLGSKKFGTRGFGGRPSAPPAPMAPPAPPGLTTVTGTGTEGVGVKPLLSVSPGTFSRPTSTRASMFVKGTEPFGEVAQRNAAGVQNDFRGPVGIEQEGTSPAELAAEQAKGGVQHDFKGRVHFNTGVELETSPSGVRGEAPVEKPPSGPLGRGTQEEANAKLRMESAAARAGKGVPGREPALTKEGHRPEAPQGGGDDAAYALMKAAEDARNATARQSKAKPPPPVLPAIPESSALAGFTRKPTMSLKDMVAQYGEQGAAQRAGMRPNELKLRVEFGDDAKAMHTASLERLGATETNSMFGTKYPTTGKLPPKAIEGIRAAAERERAVDGKVSEKTQKLLDRIKSEQGAVPVRGLLAGAGVVGGGVLGSLKGAKNDDERLGNAALGAVGGGAAGLLAPSLIGKGMGAKALALRREAFLTGGAIPKNIMTDFVSAPMRATAENTGTTRLGPAKELLLSPGKNAKAFWHSLQQPAIQRYPDEVHFGKFQPSKVIGAIDDTAREAMKRAGVSQENIDRYLLSADRNMFKPKVGKDWVTPEGRSAVNFAFPFQRVPTNVLMEGANEVGHTAKSFLGLKPDMRAALNVLQTGGGYALGKWAGNDPKKKWIVSILLAGAGPNALGATMGATAGAGLSGFGAGSLGGLSPVPEQAFDVKSYLGAKPAFWTMGQRLGVIPK